MRIADLNLVDRLRSGFPFNGKLDQYGIERITANDGEEVWRGNIEISASRNILTRTGVPLKDVIDTSQPGVHVVTAQDSDDELDRWEDRATQWILVSDLGITTFKSDNGLTVFLNSHMTTEPVSGARLKLVARNNRVLGETTTDMNGRADFAAGLLNGLGGADPRQPRDPRRQPQ